MSWPEIPTDQEATIGEKMYLREMNRTGRSNVKIVCPRHRLYNITSYDLFLSDSFSLLEDMPSNHGSKSENWPKF